MSFGEVAQKLPGLYNQNNVNNYTGVLTYNHGGTGLSSITANGILYASSSSQFAQITTANNGVLITSGGGVPSISLTLPNAVQLNITALGTITTGVWNGTAVDVSHGGTGLTTATTAYGVVCAGTTATGNFQVLNALGASGTVLTSNGPSALPSFQASSAGAFVKIGTATASSSATISFTGLSATYLYYQLVLVSVIPQTSTANMLMRFSTNNGSSYDSTSGHYEYQAVYSLASNSTTTIGSTSATSFIICNSMGTNANTGANGFINIYNPSQANDIGITFEVVYPFSSATSWNGGSGSGLYLVTTGAVNALQILMSSGNISSGTFELYGVTA
jgi:hypothetical protein